MDQLKTEIFLLNIRYYQMRISEDEVRRYDDSSEINREIRDVLIKALNINRQLFDDQNKVVEKLIEDIKK